MEPLVVLQCGPEVWVLELIHLLVELLAELLVVVGTESDVWVVDVAAVAAEFEPGALLVLMTVPGCVFQSGHAVEVGAGVVKEVEDRLGVVVAIGEVFEFSSKAEGAAEIDAGPGKIAEIETGDEAEDKAGDKAGAEAEVVAEPKSVAELGLVVSGHDTFHSHLSEVFVA